MTLEDLIYQRLVGPDGPAELLTRFRGKPAVFYQEAPDDADEGWAGAPQFPRIDYVVEMRANPERNTSGTMTLNIWCSELTPPPEEIEPVVRTAFREGFLTPVDGTPYSLSWLRSDAFTFGGKYPANANLKDPNIMVFGVTLTFDVYAFPRQESADPDPILAINAFAKDLFPESMVIGSDTLPTFLTAGTLRPILYFRLTSLKVQKETFFAVWLDGVIAGHVFAPDQVRTMWVRSLMDALAFRGEVTMLDGSPMLMQSVKVDAGADPLSEGQLRLGVRFGMLRRHYAHKLINVNTAFMDTEGASPKPAYATRLNTVRRKSTWQQI